jgi:hypothetical protein
MSNPFKDIYNKNLNKDYGTLFKSFAEKTLDNSSQIKEVKYSEETTLQEIEQIVMKSRENLEVPLTESESKKAMYFIDALKEESPLIRKDLFDFKSALHADILQQNDKFSLDISKNESLRKAAIEVFDTEKNKITYEDYSVLLELKKQIEVNEQIDLLLEEQDGIFE